MFDAVAVPGGQGSVNSLLEQGDAKHFVAEAFKHKKPIAALAEGIDLLEAVELPEVDLSEDGLVSDEGIVTSRESENLEPFVEAFVDAIAEHRHWERSPKEVPA